MNLFSQLKFLVLLSVCSRVRLLTWLTMHLPMLCFQNCKQEAKDPIKHITTKIPKAPGAAIFSSRQETEPSCFNNTAQVRKQPNRVLSFPALKTETHVVKTKDTHVAVTWKCIPSCLCRSQTHVDTLLFLTNNSCGGQRLTSCVLCSRSLLYSLR